MTPSLLWICLLVAVASLAAVLVVARSGLLYRSSRFLAWRQAKSRRERGTVRAGGPSDGSGTDPTAGASF